MGVCVCVCVTGDTNHVDGAGDVYPSKIWVLRAFFYAFLDWFLPHMGEMKQ